MSVGVSLFLIGIFLVFYQEVPTLLPHVPSDMLSEGVEEGI